jgi:Fe-S cluster assembly ATPase SufC
METSPVVLPKLMIAVMGVTGAGKSSFIKTVTGRDDVGVGHGLRSRKQSSIRGNNSLTDYIDRSRYD